KNSGPQELISMKNIAVALWMVMAVLTCQTILAQDFLFEFGEVVPLNQVLEEGTSPSPEPIRWYNVNTEIDTWEHQDSILVCHGRLDMSQYSGLRFSFGIRRGGDVGPGSSME